MKNLSALRSTLITLAALAGVHTAPAQGMLLHGVMTNQQVLVYWGGNRGGTNGEVQSATNLARGTWSVATDVSIAARGTNLAVSVGQSLAFRFLRLVLMPPTVDGMALIPAGTFTMGDTLDGERDAIPPTNVYVSGFYMDMNLVRYSQWQSVYAYATGHGYGFDNGGLAKNSVTNQPVQTVDWYDCLKWCNARSQQAGLTSVYYTNAAMLPTQVYTTGDFDAVSVNWTNSGYRLPTEAEWEKAARGGLSGQRFPWGDTINESQANYDAYFAEPGDYDLGPYGGFNTNFDTGGYPYTSPVGYFAPNGYGLNDMTGNLWEWCWDWYNTPYAGGTNPLGGGDSGIRVQRSGFWYSNAYGTRCALRGLDDPGDAGNNIGFRCVRGL